MKNNLNHYLAIQYKEILEHKWYLSEQAGYDVGIEFALNNWCRGCAKTFRDRYDAHRNSIENICNRCNKCNGLEECVLTTEEIHKLLED